VEGKSDKIHWKPGNMLYPAPAVLVSCGTSIGQKNLFTVSWVGTICTNPPMLSISIRPERHSYSIIKESGEFVVNLTTKAMAFATDYCGVRSGRNEDKWKKTKLTPYPSKEIKAPQILESPVSIECKVKEIIALGSHDLFISNIVNISVLPELLNDDGSYRLKESDLLIYTHGMYGYVNEYIDTFGFSVRKKKKSPRNQKLSSRQF
jgi:flavin reductase (DIM6/NTAB) family NADH-FMN oxidoreductase RutF